NGEVKKLAVGPLPEGLLTHLGLTSDMFQDDVVVAVERRLETSPWCSMCTVPLDSVVSTDIRGFDLAQSSSVHHQNVYALHTTVRQTANGEDDVEGLGTMPTYGAVLDSVPGRGVLPWGCTSSVVRVFYRRDAAGGAVTVETREGIKLPILGDKPSGV
ncbi:unnamed protein product, partial [Laminaria digitata]